MENVTSIVWDCPICNQKNVEYPDPWPVIAECAKCGHAESNYQEFGLRIGSSL